MGAIRVSTWAQVKAPAEQLIVKRGRVPRGPRAHGLTAVAAGARAALFPSGASLGIPTSEPRMLDKGHQEPAWLGQSPAQGEAGMDIPSGLALGRAGQKCTGDLGTPGTYPDQDGLWP